MRERVVAKRYAKSLIELATEAGELDKLFADMIVVNEIAAGVLHFIEGLADERVRLSRRLEAAKRVIGELKLLKITGDSILLLMHKGCIALLPLIARSVLRNVRTRKSLTVASVQVANRALAEGVGERVGEILSEVLGMTVESEVDIDRSLIGGFVVEVGDLRYDSSIKGKLTKMKEEFFSEARGL